MNTSHLHSFENVHIAGAPLQTARRAMILVHGRGGSAEDILTLSRFFEAEIGKNIANDIAFLAPEATHNTWYPNSFLAPSESNEPSLSSGLQVIQDCLAHVQSFGISAEQTYLLGFSQGACLALEFAARSAQRFGGILGFSGGVIGPVFDASKYAGNFAETPVFLGCSDRDPHIPKSRVEETSALFTTMGAKVEMKLYPNMPHTIIQDEIETAQRIVNPLLVGV
jgi:phospholipase/carboxylesterase